MMKIMRCACLCGLMFALGSTAFAQTRGRDMEKERQLWEQLAAIAPQAVEKFKAATVAFDKDEWAEAARLYEEVLKQAPQFDPAMRLGGTLMYLGRNEEGLGYLKKALKLKRSPENLGGLARALAYPDGDKKNPNNGDMETAFTFAREAFQRSTGDDPYYAILLAHEYGNFLHRDTAGGDVALRVNADMMRFADAMIQSGQATRWNIAFQFLRLYHFLFRRITHGATRLQEVQADRIAVQQFGATAFEEGLTHAIRREVEFHHLASKEVNEVIETRRAMQNLYDLPEVQDEEQKTLVAEVEAILNRETTEDDTHPSPAHRFRLAARIRCQNETPATGMVWELFSNREGLTKEMNSLIDEQVKAAV